MRITALFILSFFVYSCSSSKQDDLSIIDAKVKNGELEAALKVIDSIQSVNGKIDPVLRYLTSFLYSDLGNCDSVVTITDRIIENREHADYKLYNNYAKCLHQLNRDSEALNALNASRLTFGENQLLNYNFAVIYLDFGNYTEAINYFDKELALNPGHENSLINKAVALSYLGECEKAISLFEPFEADLTEGEFDRYMYCYLNTHSDDENLHIAERALTLFPNSEFLLIRAASVYGLNKNFEKAIELCARVIDEAPENDEAEFLIGLAYLNMDSIALSCEHFKRAYELGSEMVDDEKLYLCGINRP